MTNLTHPSVTNLIHQMEDRIPETSSGTYNRMDPTHYSKGNDTFTYRGREFQIIFNDCTWGIEFELYLIKGFKPRLFSKFYWDRDDNQLIKRNLWFKHTYRLLREYIKQTEPIDRDYYHECMDICPGDYI